MITMNDFFEVTKHQITSGSRYMWQCYGNDAYNIESWSGETYGWAVDMVFDREHQTVYQVGVYDFENDRAVRWINPEFVDAHMKEALEREVNPNEAWDDVDFVDAESSEDWLKAANEIVAGRNVTV